MVEAELKAELSNPDAVRSALQQRAGEPEIAVYRDTYYDTPDEALSKAGRELRVRIIETADGIRHLLTFKEPAVDAASDSKPEYETAVASVDVIRRIVAQLGYAPAVHLTKFCENYSFTLGDRSFLATIVNVPQLAGTFLEVETMAEEREVAAALAAVGEVFSQLGVPTTDLTTEKYTDAVAATPSVRDEILNHE